MTTPVARVRSLCLALPATWEKVSHGEPTFWVGKRMFATFANAKNHHGAGRDAVWCKCSFVTQDHLLCTAPMLYFRPPYVGATGWIGVYLDGDLDWAAVGDRLRYAHDLAAGSRRRRGTHAPAEAARQPPVQSTQRARSPRRP